MKNSKEQQRKLVELQLLDQVTKQIEQNLVNIEGQINELKKLTESLEDIKKVKEGTEIFVPIGAGVFTKAQLKENKEILVNVGSGVVVKKSFDEAKEIVEKQTKELEELFSQNQAEFNRVVLEIGALQKEFQEIEKEK